jgi:hypothetical protein
MAAAAKAHPRIITPPDAEKFNHEGTKNTKQSRSSQPTQVSGVSQSKIAFFGPRALGVSARVISPHDPSSPKACPQDL